MTSSDAYFSFFSIKHLFPLPLTYVVLIWIFYAVNPFSKYMELIGNCTSNLPLGMAHLLHIEITIVY